MPRGRSSSNSSSRSRSSYGSRSSSPTPQKSVPQQSHQQTMPVQPQSGGMMSGLGSTLMTGMAFGAGSEIAHQAVRGVMGGGSHGNGNSVQESKQEVQQNSQPQQQYQQNPCQNYNMKFVECLKGNGNDISDCQNFFNDLKTCEQGFK